MADLVAAVASRTGIPPEQVQKGVGVLLSHLKGRIDPGLYARIESALPGAPEMVASSEAAAEGGGANLFGAVAGMAGKMLGGKSGEAGQLLASLSAAGLSTDQIQKLLPRVLETLPTYLPPDLVEKIKAALPASTATAPAGESEATTAE